MNFPLAPFVHNSQDVIFFFFILMRVTGMFLVAPVFSSRLAPVTVRTGLAVFVTILLTMSLYNSYRGDLRVHFLPELDDVKDLTHGATTIHLVVASAKELTVGLLIGLCFVMLFQGLLMAGQLIGQLAGFSFAEVLDPISNTSTALVGQIYVLLATVYMFTLDLHHLLFQLVADSYAWIPIGSLRFDESFGEPVVFALSVGTAKVFSYSLAYIAIPFIVSFFVTLGLSLMSRVMPEMNIFVVGFAIRILAGFYALIISIAYFPLILGRAFTEYYNLATLVIGKLAP